MAAPQPQPKRNIIAEICAAYRDHPGEDVDDEDNPIPPPRPDPPATI